MIQRSLTIDHHSGRRSLLGGQQPETNSVSDVRNRRRWTLFAPNLLFILGIDICGQDVPSIEAFMIWCSEDEGSDLVWSKAERLGVVEIFQEKRVDLVCVECAIARSAVLLAPYRAATGQYEQSLNRRTKQNA
jgi:hypothetical protein